MGQVLAEVMLAALVTVGVISLIQWVKRALLMPPQITVAVMVMTQKDLENLDILLSEAASGDTRRRGTPVVVLISSALLYGLAGTGDVLHPEIREMLDDYGATWYAVDADHPLA